MDILEAKNLVIEAGVKLVERGLIARTWGNVSCRIDDETFVITPSGKPYIGLTPDDIVEVKIEDLSYRGNVKPSSEKGVHAEVYKAHPEANFVIHTHQKYASVISDLSKGLCDIEGEAAQVIGSVVPIAAYGMPGTGKLRKGIIAALEKYNTKAIIMAHHGAVCFGSDFDDAFNVTAVLEDLCEKAILKLSKDFTGPVETLAEMCKAIPGKFGIDSEYVCTADTAYNSEIDREAGKITFTENGADETAAVLDLATGEAVEGKLPLEAELHRSVYQANDSGRQSKMHGLRGGSQGAQKEQRRAHQKRRRAVLRRQQGRRRSGRYDYEQERTYSACRHGNRKAAQNQRARLIHYENRLHAQVFKAGGKENRRMMIKKDAGTHPFLIL